MRRSNKGLLIGMFTVLMAAGVLFLLATPSVAQTNVFPADGNAGIGTTSPQYMLHMVGGRLRIDNNAADQKSVYLYYNSSLNATVLSSFDSRKGGYKPLLINRGGSSVGIATRGAISSGLTLDVGGATGAESYCDEDGNNCSTALDIKNTKADTDDNSSRITALEATVAALQATVNSLQATVATLQTGIVPNLGDYLEITTMNGYTTALFSAVNVQVVNGTDDQTAINGLGNLIVGYNESDGFCDILRYANQSECEDSRPATWMIPVKTGSHNLVAGNKNSYSSHGGVVFGYGNSISGEYSGVTGGTVNTASEYVSSVSGGGGNTASGRTSSVSGGVSNIAIGNNSSVSGGTRNTARGDSSSVSGGSENAASEYASSVSGGHINTASGYFSSVSGGRDNSARWFYSSVSGGESNTAIGDKSSVSGGSGNTASGNSSSVSGGRDNAASEYASSVSGGNNRAVTDQYDWAAGSLWEDE